MYENDLNLYMNTRSDAIFENHKNILAGSLYICVLMLQVQQNLIRETDPSTLRGKDSLFVHFYFLLESSAKLVGHVILKPVLSQNQEVILFTKEENNKKKTGVRFVVQSV